VRTLAALFVVLASLPGCINQLIGGGVEPRDYVSDGTYRHWVIEVDSSAGAQPDSALLGFVKGRLDSVAHKDSIEFRNDETLAGGDRAWSDGDLESLAAQHQGVKTGGDQVATHLLFLTGHSSHDDGNAKVLGITFGHDLIAIFSDSVKGSCASAIPLFPCDPTPYFRAVLIHEFGHALGLVNNGIPMVHNHEASSCNGAPDYHHSANQGSVMYCQVETSAIVPLFGNNPPTDFDSDDKADLCNAGGRCS
jgi:hypothetical protein